MSYFAAENDSGLGSELWVTDGTRAGTRLVRDIHWGSWSASPEYLATIDAGLVFQANPGRKFGGPTLWISDGTRAGTHQVKDLADATFGSYPAQGTVAGSNLYFLASMWGIPAWQPIWKLWRTDGTTRSTQPVLDLIEGKAPPQQYYRDEFPEMTEVAGALFVSGRSPKGWGLWRIGGDSAEVTELAQVVPVAPTRALNELTDFQRALYFFSDDEQGRALWRLGRGQSWAARIQGGMLEPRDLSSAGDRLLFVANGDELWWSDGPPAGTRKIRSLGLPPDVRVDQVQPFNDRFIFRVRWLFNPWGRTNRTALWISDGTAAGTYKLRRPYPQDLVIINRGILYSYAGRLWLSHGATRGVPISEVPEVGDLMQVGNQTFFQIGSGESLWTTDGTPAGTVPVVEGLNILAADVIDGALYFSGYGAGARQPDLFRLTDGSAQLVKRDLWLIRSLGPGTSRFVGWREGEPQQIWATDGTETGTRQLTHLQPSSMIGSVYREPDHFLVNDRLMMIIDDGVHGAEWWTFDAYNRETEGGFIGDYTWLDLNEDGIQGDDEPGLAGVTVYLEDCRGRTVATTTSDGSGRFGFGQLPSGDYQPRFERPFAYVFSPWRAGSDYRLDSNADPATGRAFCAPLAADQHRRAIDAGFIEQQQAQLGDRVWHDLDGDGLQDEGEPGVSGVTVRLETCGGTVLQTTRTNPQGQYLFDYVTDGDYRLHFNAPDGYRFSPKNAGDDFRIDSNAHPESGEDACRTVRAGQLRLALDAGLVSP